MSGRQLSRALHAPIVAVAMVFLIGMPSESRAWEPWTPEYGDSLSSVWRYPTALRFHMSLSDFPPVSPQRFSVLYGVRAWEGPNLSGSAISVAFDSLSTGDREDFNGSNEIMMKDLQGTEFWDDVGVTYRHRSDTAPYEILEADIVLNSYYQHAWRFYGQTVDTTRTGSDPPYSQYDFTQLVAHEFGHALGLGHEDQLLSTMTEVYYPGTWNGGLLHADDRNAVRRLYPANVGGVNETDLQATGWKDWIVASGHVGLPLAEPETIGGAPPPFSPGDTLLVEVTVENLGTKPTGVPEIGFYLTSGLSFDPGTATPFSVVSFGEWLDPAAGGFPLDIPVATMRLPVVLPCWVSAGTYYVWWQVDPTSGIGDVRRINNFRIVGRNNVPLPVEIAGTCPPTVGAAPGPPADVSASDSFCDDCEVTWRAPTTGGPVETYRVYRAGQPLFPGYLDANSPDVCPGGACTYWDEALNPGTYDYYVVSYNDSGSAQSSVTQGTVIPNPLPAPSDIYLSTDRCDGIMLTWNWPLGVANPDSFFIYRSSQPSWIARVAGNRREFLDPSAGTGTPTSYYVRAVTYANRCQRQGASTTAGIRRPQFTGSPTISVASGRCDGVELAWTYTMPSWSEWGYEVFRDSTGNSIGPMVHTTADRTDTTWLDITARPGTQYFYRVRAIPPPSYVCNPSGNSNAAPAVRAPTTLTILSNVVGATISDNGAQAIVLPSGYVVPCSLLSVTPERMLEAPPTQYIDGTKYCFDSWSDGGFRSHTVTVTSDTTITLNLVPSGSGPTPYQAGALVPPDLSDCRSPHIFQGSASAPNGLTVHPGTTLRFPYDPNGPAYAGLNVQRHLYATDATFETVDGANNDKVGAWLGISYTDPFSVLSLQRCAVRNAVSGVARSAGTVSTAAIDSCTFAKNNFDLVLEFEESATPGQSAHLFRNFFTAQRAVQIIGAELTGSAPVAADIDYNTFASSSNNSTCLSLTGGFSGHVNSNVLNMGNTGNIGVEMAARGALYPAVSFTGNLFQFATPQRTCMIAPTVSGHPYLSAVYNNWNQSAASDIESMIYHYKDTASKAEVVFEPFTTPPGGGGGGGGGCPFVLSRQPDGSYLIENSILGASELGSGEPRSVTDAYPLRHVHIEEHGRVNLRIAEVEPETDYLDHVGLTALSIPDGADIGVDPSGGLVVFRPIPESAQVVSWTGRNVPYISPIAGQAFTGEPGDSLEFEVKAALPPGMPISRRFNIAMIPKPQEAPAIRGDRVGVTVRVAGSGSHNWVTLGPLVPRALWSNAVLPLELPAGASPDRVRIVWNTQHALGWAGLVEVVEPLSRVELPCRGAVRSTGGDESASLARVDGVGATLETGQHIDLSFDAASAPERARFVLSSTGRYVLATRQAPGVPSVAYAEQNSPNPFNPRTEIRYGVPAAMRVRILVYDVSGRLVRSILDRVMAPGHHTASWDGTGVGGGRVASGVYFYEVRAGSFAARRRMVLLR